ncbi:MAG TPA: lipoyl synthase [Acidimicrobiia bacterium]|nr:lipoyl synthase [Acidimicrobiia bacterium]
MNESTLHVRSLGRVSYEEGDSLQRALHKSTDDYLLFLEHYPVYTCGSATKPEHLKSVADGINEVVDVDRGGSITFHGPGQLVGYPVVTVGETRGDLRSSLSFIRSLQDVLIEALRILGVEAIAKSDYTGVWVDRGEELADSERYVKIAAIGVKVAKGRTRHGFALNISTDLDAFSKIVPCGIEEYGVTSLHQLGFEHISHEEITETITKTFLERFSYDEVDIASVSSPLETDLSRRESDVLALSHAVPTQRAFPSTSDSLLVAQDHDEKLLTSDLSRFSREAVSPLQPSLRLLGRLAQAGVAVDLEKDRRARPEWMKNKVKATEGFKELKELSRDLNLHTVCEEAGCPNIYECWESKTATFMILGERCTRACTFCLVDTRKPEAVDASEPRNVAVAISSLGLEFAVITCVARDDLDDDGAEHFAQTVREIRALSPNTGIELLISDCRGRSESLDVIFAERPDVINHNIETVARIQRAVRPSAGYARSLSVLARAKAADLTTKSGIIVGMGETSAEILQTLRDLKNVGVDIVTIGQYLQPTPSHLPVHRFVEPSEFAMYKEYGELIGISHVESGPLVRSSYHAKSSAQAAQ